MKIISITILCTFFIGKTFGQVSNIKTGLWSDKTVWNNNALPTGNDDVILTFNIIVDINAHCKSLKLNGNKVTVNTGVTLDISDSIHPVNCDGLVTDTLGTNDSGRIYMPSAFTPNNDHHNDIVHPITQNISSLTFTVYDAANNIVFTTNELGQAWAPTVAANTYVKYFYKIQAVTNNNRKIGKCGDLYKLSCYPADVPIQNFYFEDQLTINGFTGMTFENLPACQ